jgi:hypothetical protein
MTRYQWTPVRVRCYGKTLDQEVLALRCLWYGALKGQPLQVILSRPLGAPDGYELALVTTDLTATPQAIIERYADRWSAEQAFLDARHLVGVGQARTRTRRSVERLVPFGLCCLSLAILWYARHGQPAHTTLPPTVPARLGAATSAPSRSPTCSPRSAVPCWPPNISTVTKSHTPSTYSQICCSPARRRGITPKYEGLFIPSTIGHFAEPCGGRSLRSGVLPVAAQLSRRGRGGSGPVPRMTRGGSVRQVVSTRRFSVDTAGVQATARTARRHSEATR